MYTETNFIHECAIQNLAVQHSYPDTQPTSLLIFPIRYMYLVLSFILGN